MRFVFLLFLFVTLNGVAQIIPDSVAVRRAREQARYLYERAMEGTQHLYNGSEYIAYQPLDEEHPYFLTDEWTSGPLKYDGEWFYDVPLLFDIDREALIASYYYKGTKMQLNTNRIDEFTISGHRFIHSKNVSSKARFGDGLYELLHDGKTKVLAKRVKKYNEKIEGTEEFRRFAESNQIYLLFNNESFKISGKQDLLRVLKQNKKELTQFIRKNNLFVVDRESSIIQVAKYFDSLNP